MAERTIDHSGRDVPRKPRKCVALPTNGTEFDNGVATSEQEQEAPAWHAIVGEGWEPVQFGDETLETDEVLRSQGWVRFRGGGGFTYQVDMIPRRRRKRFPVTITITGERDGKLYCQRLDAETGDRFEVGPDGSLVSLDHDSADGRRA